jgi:hypothetical protein
MNTVQIVPLEYVPSTLPYVETYIAEAFEHSQGDYTVEEARVLLTRGLWQLTVAVDEQNQIHGCAVIEYYNRPRDRVAFIVASGGKFITNKDTLQQLFTIMQTHGATCVEGAVRKSMARLLRHFGFAEKYHVVGRKL